MRIGVFGGTFDPPHNGHLGLAQAAIDALELDEVLFMPANKNPLKSRAVDTSAEDRLEMVRRLIEPEPKMAVSDIEMMRGGWSYAVDTMADLHMVRPADYWFLMGADTLRSLADWKNPQRLLRLARLGVVIRPPITEHDALGRIPVAFRERVDIIRMSPQDISSTELREKIIAGESVQRWLPVRVLEYIHEKGLYKTE